MRGREGNVVMQLSFRDVPHNDLRLQRLESKSYGGIVT